MMVRNCTHNEINSVDLFSLTKYHVSYILSEGMSKLSDEALICLFDVVTNYEMYESEGERFKFLMGLFKDVVTEEDKAKLRLNFIESKINMLRKKKRF